MHPQPPHTPLRRVSQGSLFRLSRSQDQAASSSSDAPAGLAFLPPALAELADEAESLQACAQGLQQLSASIGAFNDAFASWLYAMDMNALTVEWYQAPSQASFEVAKRRAGPEQSAKTDTENTTTVAPDTTVTANETTIAESKSAGKVVKKKGKPKMTAKEKKERSIAVDKTVMALPLEFRGNDPTLRRHVESVIEKLMDNVNKGLKILEFVKPPDLNQARVNKCLIALVNRKIVRKDNSTGVVLYHWQGVPP
ncbi:hypothetical protein K488DRAFT_71873 [Vararia minispora EC-137]|uniref:Uncharacterized protein n=1 Tax=Vararia minispora EC-137 TaxID=1314806 RepID=A0ACB8QGR3_9AGAM|nr:hypothetical protein K488DRAFT_71873 [Vararia minispora EC-137]